MWCSSYLVKMLTETNSAAVFSRLGCADDAIANFPPTLDAGPVVDYDGGRR